jgi:LysR family transcriptional regulator of gallate degradation
MRAFHTAAARLPGYSRSMIDVHSGAAPASQPLPLPLHKLRAFAAVAQLGNVHRAALAIHLSQPAVTRAIQHLEAALGAALFERTTRGMTLTSAGLLVHRRVQRAFDALARAACGTDARWTALISERMLACLVAIARAGSEAAAARSLGLSQPALHRHLHQLELATAAPLLARSTRGTRLTEAGEVLLRHAKLALAEITVAAAEVASLQGRLAGRIVIGALPLSSGRLVPQAADRTLRQHPGVRISIVDGAYDTLRHGLCCADIDVIVGALRSDELEPYIHHEPLFEDTLSVVARSHHPVFRLPRPQGLADLAGASWVAPLPDTPGRAGFERAFAAAGVAVPSLELQCNSTTIVRSLLVSSDRLALLSTRQIQQELQQGVLAVVPVPLRGTRRMIGLATLRDSVASPALLALLGNLRQLARQAPRGAAAAQSAAAATQPAGPADTGHTPDPLSNPAPETEILRLAV